jgi:hypothetical protein
MSMFSAIDAEHDKKIDVFLGIRAINKLGAGRIKCLLDELLLEEIMTYCEVNISE